MRPLTTTSFAILGLLSVRSWTTYELAQQMRRSLRHYWPRAESKLYEEPKHLVAHGLARADRQRTGRRPRTVFSITPAGQQALAEWLGQPGTPEPSLEFEALVRVVFADAGTTDQLLTTLARVREAAEKHAAHNVERAREYLETGGPFPHRLHLVALVSRFIIDYWGMVGTWAQWAEREVATWPSVDLADREGLARVVFGPLVSPHPGAQHTP